MSVRDQDCERKVEPKLRTCPRNFALEAPSPHAFAPESFQNRRSHRLPRLLNGGHTDPGCAAAGEGLGKCADASQVGIKHERYAPAARCRQIPRNLMEHTLYELLKELKGPDNEMSRLRNLSWGFYGPRPPPPVGNAEEITCHRSFNRNNTRHSGHVVLRVRSAFTVVCSSLHSEHVSALKKLVANGSGLIRVVAPCRSSTAAKRPSA